MIQKMETKVISFIFSKFERFNRFVLFFQQIKMSCLSLKLIRMAIKQSLSLKLIRMAIRQRKLKQKNVKKKIKKKETKLKKKKMKKRRKEVEKTSRTLVLTMTRHAQVIHPFPIMFFISIKLFLFYFFNLFLHQKMEQKDLKELNNRNDLK